MIHLPLVRQGPLRALAIRLMLALRRWRLKQIGEPWRTHFDPAQLVAQLRDLGFRDVTDFTPELINERYFSRRGDGLKVGTVGHVVRAVNELGVES